MTYRATVNIEQAREIVRRTFDDGGCTWEYDPVIGGVFITEPQYGFRYVVAIEETWAVLGADGFDADDVRLFVENKLTVPGRCLGTWYDEENREVHLDVVALFDTLDEAMRLAKLTKQKAIYDLATRETLAVEVTA